jgi:hypothetical protein
MRTIFAIVVALGLGISTAWAQTAPAHRDSQPQTQPPTQSSPSPSTTGRAQPQAPVGHRQPRAADVPPETGTTVPPGQKRLDRELRICRDC